MKAIAFPTILASVFAFLAVWTGACGGEAQGWLEDPSGGVDASSGFGGGTGGQAGTIDGGLGGAGGNPGECRLSIDCPISYDECTVRTCSDGQCGTELAPAGTPALAQVSGDCMKSICVGDGSTTSVVDDTDIPWSANVCVEPICSDGIPTFANLDKWTPCAVGVACDGSGNCAIPVCDTDSDCGTSDACTTYACSGLVCSTTLSPAGTPCHVDGGTQCDGSGKCLLHAVNVVASGSQSCTITSTGKAMCWGDNYDGELGNGSTTNSGVPKPVHGISAPVVAISS